MFLVISCRKCEKIMLMKIEPEQKYTSIQPVYCPKCSSEALKALIENKQEEDEEE